MKLVIDIPEIDYNTYKHFGNKGTYSERIIANGTPYEERPKGKWIELPKSINDNELPCECSICGHVLGFYYGYPKSNFCPNCGADMRGNEI